MKINYYGFKAIYLHEMNRFRRTLGQSLLSPVISTSLYFVVFGSVIGGYIEKIDGVSYGSFIVPGLLMLTLLTQSISNTSFGIFFPKFNGTINEILAAPISTLETVLAFVGAGATKTLMVGTVIFITASFFEDVTVLVAPAPTKAKTVSRVEIGAAKISLIVPLNFGKNIPNDVLLIDWVSKVNINKPGTIYEP